MAIAEKDVMLKERIKHLLWRKKTTINRIADTDTERVRLSRQINGDMTLVTYDTIYKLLYMFPDVSAEWLVRGEGSMDRASEVAPKYYTINHNNNNHDNGIVNIGADMSVTEQVADLRRQLEEVTKDRDLLKGLLEAITKKQ